MLIKLVKFIRNKRTTKIEDQKRQEYLLSESFSDTIKEELVDIIGELSEVGLDTIIENDILEAIPFISTVISMYKIGATIREKQHLKKIAIFIREIKENIDNDKREQYIEKFKENEKFRSEELEYILIILDRYLNYDKSKWLARLYLAYLRKSLSWREFMQYSEMINNFLPGDELFLKYDKVPRDIPYRYYDTYVERFCSMGLLEKEYIQEPLLNISGKPFPVNILPRIKNSELGIKLFRIIFR